MTQIAIVGTSIDLTKEEDTDVRKLISDILDKYIPISSTVITGGAKGVDSIAEEIALLNGFAVKPIFPLGQGWEFNKKRNIEIAQECEELFCITVPVHTMKCYHHETQENHQKTAGCWTLNRAIKLNKKTKLLVTPQEIHK